MVEYRFLIKFSRIIYPIHLFYSTQYPGVFRVRLRDEHCSSLLMCCDEDKSTTNQISRMDASSFMCDTRKPLPIRLERIPDANVPIGTNLDLHQASFEDGKEIFETAP
jgi:hypothetical protein